jgi:tRNA 2-selenouridine synthase
MKGREAAIMQGLELAGPKLSLFLEKARMLKIENDMVVHCWRGGMRSRAMAWLYNFAGFRCHVIEGGYKACRQTMKAFLGQPFRLIILGGMTGSGKTEILHELRRLGEQVIDLEFLAHHKGSAFGGIGQLGQPSTEQFENNLFKHWFKLDPRKPIWIEDESKSIGSVSIPDEIFLQMRRNPVLELRVDRDCRIERLVRDYAGHDPQKLKTSVERIHKRLGGQVVQESMRAIDTGQYAHAADLILNYYDRRYTMGLNRRPAHSRHPVPVANASLQRQAQQVLDAAGKLGFYREKEVHFHDV